MMLSHCRNLTNEVFEMTIEDNPYNVELTQEDKQRVSDLVEQGNVFLKSSAESVIEFGKVLIQLKSILRGNFMECVRREYDLDDQMARNIMNVAKRFGDKPKFILDLKPTVLYHLASPSTPYSVTEDVFHRVQANEKVSVALVRDLIRKSKLTKEETPNVDLFDNPNQVPQKDIDTLEKQLKAKMEFLIAEAERVKKDLDKLYLSVRDKSEFTERASLAFRVKSIPNSAKRVLNTLLNPDNLIDFFNLNSVLEG